MLGITVAAERRELVKAISRQLPQTDR